MACATLPDADAALAQLAEDYITQTDEHAPGVAPTPTAVNRAFGLQIEKRLGARAAEVLSLPGRKLPDRADFKAYGDDEAGGMRAWRCALAESQRLADEFAVLVADGRPVEALPLR